MSGSLARPRDASWTSNKSKSKEKCGKDASLASKKSKSLERTRRTMSVEPTQRDSTEPAATTDESAADERIIPSDSEEGQVDYVMEEEEEEERKEQREQTNRNSISVLHPTKPAKIYHKEKLKTFLVFLLFAAALILNRFALSIVSEIVSRNALPDLSHSLFEQADWALHSRRYLRWCGVELPFYCMILFHKHRWIVARRIFYILTILYVMRAISIIVTHTPTSYQNSNEVCRLPSANFDHGFLFFASNMFIGGFNMFGLGEFIPLPRELPLDRPSGILCGDLLFSDLTTSMSTMSAFANHYLANSLWPVKMSLGVCLAVSMCFSVISRSNYTVDVIMGYFLSHIIFSLYHAFCAVPHRQRRKASAFRRVVLFWTMFECERRTPAGALPKQLSWPWKQPKFLHRVIEEFSNAERHTVSGRIALFLTRYRMKLHM